MQWRAAAIVAAAVVLIDQIAKAWSGQAGGARFGHVENHGLLLGVAAVPAPVLVIWMLVVMTVFVVVIARISVQLGVSPAIPALIAGGFTAHVIDRAFYGAVRDFIHVRSLVLDVADIAVVVGILALGIACVWRLRQMRAASCTVELDLRNLRAVVTPAASR